MLYQYVCAMLDELQEPSHSYQPILLDYFNMFRTLLISSHKLNQGGLPALTGSYRSWSARNDQLLPKESSFSSIFQQGNCKFDYFYKGDVTQLFTVV